MIDIIYTIWLRNVKRYLRSRSRIIGSLGIPLFLIIVLGSGLSPMAREVGYERFIIPGAIAMSVLFASVASGIMVIWDKQFGFLKEMLVAPVSRLEIMIGQTLGGASAALIQGSIILFFSFFIAGFPGPGVLIAITFMILIGLAFTAMGIAFASRMEDMQGFQLIMNFIVFPIFGLSGALFPIENLPSWLLFLTRINPLTYGVEGIRYGLLGSSQTDPVMSFVFMSGFTLLMFIIGARLFRDIRL
jgi:ABC-2 type transport system permease protein